MRLKLTPQNIEDAYNYLKNTAPFNKWGLPDADDLEFRVVYAPKSFGHLEISNSKKLPIIAVSAAHVKDTLNLLGTIAHETVHLKRFMDDGKRGMNHGPKFKALAKVVCRVHGWDHKHF